MKNISVPKSVIEVRQIIDGDGFADAEDVIGTRILWFSRHELTDDQRADLHRIYGEGGKNPLLIIQHSATINKPQEIPDLMSFDVWAIVAPLPLQQEFLKMAGERPVIFCKSKRIILPDGEKVQFIFDGWHQIERIEVVTKQL